MPYIIPIAVAIGVAVTTAVAAVAATVAAIVAAIVATVSTIVATAVAIVAVAAASVAEVMSILYFQAAIMTSTIAFYGAAILVPTAHAVYNFIAVIASSFKAFLEAIHIHIIIAAHEIAFIASERYRAMINKVYDYIEDAADALDLPAQFLSLTLRNARNVVHSATSFIGRPYDIGEIQWLGNMNSFLEKFSKKTEAYRENPAAVFSDIDEWIIKDNVDMKAGAAQTILLAIEGTVDAVKVGAEDAIRLREDLDTFIMDLPSNIRDQITPYVQPYFEKFDNTVEGKILPRIAFLDKVTEEISGALEMNKGEIGSIVNRLTKPGDILSGIDDLPIEDREIQEDKIGDVAFRPLTRDSDSMAITERGISSGLSELAKALREPREPEPWQLPEEEKPIRPRGVKAVPRKTWFVGDF